jgi:hypothetical protein
VGPGGEGVTRIARDYRHFETHRDCYYEPSCPRCWLYAYLDLFVLFVRIDRRPVR